jgi:hypothetical protein
MNRFIFDAMMILICMCNFEFASNQLHAEGKEALKNQFEEKYEKWQEWQKENPFRSDPSGSPALREIAKIGIPGIPLIIEKIEEKDDMYLDFCIFLITRKVFEKSEWPPDKLGDSHTGAKMYVEWWKEGRKKTPEQFSGYFQDWRRLTSECKTEEAKAKLKNLTNLGIDALPLMIEKIREGNTEFIPIISFLTNEAIKKDASPDTAIKWWAENKQNWLLPPVED